MLIVYFLLLIKEQPHIVLCGSHRLIAWHVIKVIILPSINFLLEMSPWSQIFDYVLSHLSKLSHLHFKMTQNLRFMIMTRKMGAILQAAADLCLGSNMPIVDINLPDVLTGALADILQFLLSYIENRKQEMLYLLKCSSYKCSVVFGGRQKQLRNGEEGEKSPFFHSIYSSTIFTLIYSLYLLLLWLVPLR